MMRGWVCMTGMGLLFVAGVNRKERVALFTHELGETGSEIVPCLFGCPFYGGARIVLRGFYPSRRDSGRGIWRCLRGGRGAGSATGDFRQSIAADLLGVVTGHERGAGRPAATGVVDPSEAQAVARESIELWGVDFGAIAADVGETEIIGKDDDDVGPCRNGQGVANEDRAGDGEQVFHE